MDAYEIEFTQLVQADERVHRFTLSKLRVPRDSPVKLAILNNQAGLSVSSEKATVRYDLQLRTDTKLGTETIELRDLRLSPGRSQFIRPRNWRKLQLKDIEIEERPLERSVERPFQTGG